MEILLLLAIAYAGARGVESLTGTSDRRHRGLSAGADTTVAAIADGPDGPDGAGDKLKKKAPGPAEPGGTFSSSAPRSALLGGKAAVPLAVLTETGSTMWKATVEGYRERWPEIRAERRKKMAERAVRREAEKEAAKEAALAKAEADKAFAAAGPPPSFPPGTAPEDGGAEPRSVLVDPADTPVPPDPDFPFLYPDDVDRDRVRAEAAEARAEEARREAEEARARAAMDRILAAQREAAEANERARRAEETAREAEERIRELEEKNPTPTPTPDPDPAPGADRPRLTVVRTAPEPTNGESMSATLIPEIRTLDGLMNALTMTSAMCLMRAEEADAVAADDLALSNLLDRIEAEMADFEVDAATRAEVDSLRESIRVQAQSAARYGLAAKDSAELTTVVAQSAYKSHGGIAEAVQSSPIELAAVAGYYDSE